MKILILGAGGMLGHKMYQELSPFFKHIVGTIRSAQDQYQHFELFKADSLIEHFDVQNYKSLLLLLNQYKPDCIINCIGVTTRKLKSHDFDTAVEINALLPHRLNKWCFDNKKKLIHFSTDCVFTGKEGNYNESSPITAQDLYGQSKALGEVKSSSHTLTLRSSIIGRELFHHTELIEWAYSQANKTINGFTNAIYTGVTTNTMCNVVRQILLCQFNLNGLYHVASSKISKYDLLMLVSQYANLNLDINPDESYQCDKSLNGQLFSRKTKITIPSWKEQIKTLTQDNSMYKNKINKRRSA